MAWVLRFLGDGSYLQFGSPVGNGISNAGDDNQHWRLEFETTLDNPSDSYVYRPIESSTISRVEVLFRKSDGLVRFVSPASGQYQWSGVDLSSPTILMCFEKPLGSRVLELYINGSLVSSDAGGDNSCDFDVYGINSGNGSVTGDLSFIKFTDFATPTNNLNADATASNHTTGQPVLTDIIGGNNATGVGFPTDGSAWIDLGGGGVTVTGATANYNYNGVAGTVDLTGSINVTGQTANYNYSGVDGVIDLVSEIKVTGQAGGYDYAGVNGSVSLTGVISVTGQTGNYDYNAVQGQIQLSGEILITGQTANYNYIGLPASVSVFDVWSLKTPVSTDWGAKTKTDSNWTIKPVDTTIWSKK